MHIKQEDYYAGFIILFISLLFSLDVLLGHGKPANMDGIVHTLTPNLFYESIKQGEFPVGWINGFANYGLPLGIIAHPLTTYLTALLTFITGNVITSYNLVGLTAVILTNSFFYFFLRFYTTPLYATAAVFFFTFTPYRILNLHIRGALPEFFATAFIPLLLIGSFLFIKKDNLNGIFLFLLAIFLISITHPFMLIIGIFLLVPYVLFLLLENNISILNRLKKLVILIMASFGGLLAAGFYLMPLNLEIKYFYYGLTKNHLTPNNFLTLENYLNPRWEYFSFLDIYNRAFIVNVGLLESVAFLLGLTYLIYLFSTKKINLKENIILISAVSAGALMIFFMSPISKTFYESINMIGNIQFPWRILAVFSFVPPMILIALLNKTRKKIAALLIITLVCFFSFPYIYGKNYAEFPKDYFTFTKYNLHATVMNPIWTGRSEDYPVKKNQSEIYEGVGNLKEVKVSNNTREYKVLAESSLKVVDYTFYFPGWKLYIDDAFSPIEFQDPNYRGVITYNVPPGEHEIKLKFEDTKVRLFSKIISGIAIILIIILFIFRKKLNKLTLSS